MTWDNSRLKRGLTESESIIRAGAGRITGVLGTVGVGVGVAGLVSGFKKMAEEMDRIGKLSTRFGVSVEALQRFGFVARQSGATLEQMAKAMNVLVQRSREANMADEFARLGIELEKFQNLAPDKMMEAFAKAISSLPDQNEQLATSLRVIGEEAGELMPTIRAIGKEGIDPLTESLQVMSDEGVRSIEAMNDAWDKFMHDMKMGAVNVASNVGNIWTNIRDTILTAMAAQARFMGAPEAEKWALDRIKANKEWDAQVDKRAEEAKRDAIAAEAEAEAKKVPKASDETRKNFINSRTKSTLPSGAGGTMIPFLPSGFVPVGDGGDDFADGIHHPNPFAPSRGGMTAAGGGLPFGLGPAIMAGGLAGMAGRRRGMRGLERLGLHRPTFRDAETYSRLDEMERAQDRSRAWDYSPDSSSAVAAMSGRDLAGSKEDVREERNAERFRNIEKATMKTAEILSDVEGDGNE